MTNQNVLGVDIGGVLIERSDDKSDTSFFGKNYLKSPAVADSFDALHTLHKAAFEIHLVSKCGSNTERKTLEWLAYNNFYAETGVDPKRVHFCRERKEKAAICTDLGIRYFVDDRLEVLSYLHDVPNRYLINSTPAERGKFAFFLPKVTQVESWVELAKLIYAGGTVSTSQTRLVET